MKKVWPLVVMFGVLAAPFAVSLALLQDKSNLGDRSKGTWLQQSIQLSESQPGAWKLVWRDQDCAGQCDQWMNLLQRLKMAMGKRQEHIEIVQTQDPELMQMDNGLFIADQKGLVLLSYQSNEDGAYHLFKDLRVLMKHSGS